MPNSLGKGVVSSVMKQGSDSYTVCLSGVLTRGEDQFRPIADLLPGTVIAYHTEGRRFHVDALIERILWDLDGAVSFGFPINIVGASMGGMLAPFVVQRLNEIYGKSFRQGLAKVVLVDAPCGLDSLKDPLAHTVLRFGPLAQVAMGLVTPLPFFGFMAELPEWDEITTEPYQLADVTSWKTRDETKQRVIDLTRESLSGHNLGLLARHTRWMIKVGKNGSLNTAVRSLDEIDTTYMACNMGNSPVKQPLAVDWWNDRLDQLKVINVEATHCGFLQNIPEFTQALQLVFG